MIPVVSTVCKRNCFYNFGLVNFSMSLIKSEEKLKVENTVKMKYFIWIINFRKMFRCSDGRVVPLTDLLDNEADCDDDESVRARVHLCKLGLIACPPSVTTSTTTTTTTQAPLSAPSSSGLSAATQTALGVVGNYIFQMKHLNVYCFSVNLI